MTQSTLASQIPLYDRRCLVASVVSNQLKLCHLVSTFRTKNPDRRGKNRSEERSGERSVVLDSVGSVPHCADVATTLVGMGCRVALRSIAYSAVQVRSCERV